MTAMAYRTLLLSYALAISSLGGHRAECFCVSPRPPAVSPQNSPRADQSRPLLFGSSPRLQTTKRLISRPQSSSFNGYYHGSNADRPVSKQRRRSAQLQASSTATLEPATTTRRRRGNRKAPTSKALFTQKLFKHDLLTKEQEHELGYAIRRAIFYQQILDNLADGDSSNSSTEQRKIKSKKKKLRRRGRPQKPLLPSRYARNNNLSYGGFGDEEQDLLNLSVYGLEQLEAPDREEWDFDNNSPSDFSATEEAAEERQRRRVLGVTMSSSDDEPQRDWNVNVKFLESLSNADVQHHFGGLGRAELQAIFLEGAIARDALIRSNYRLVVSIAKTWAKQRGGSGGALDDLRAVYNGSWDTPSLDEAIQEGILGLAKAADRFDPQKNFRFGTYATFWITSFVRRCYQDASTNGLRVPTNFYDKRSRFKALIKSYYDAGKDVPPFGELASQMELTEERLHYVLAMTRPLLSMDAPVRTSTTRTVAGKAGNDVTDGTLLGDILPDKEATANPEDEVELSFLRQSLENAMASELVPYERDIVRLRLGLDDGVARTVPQIVEEYGGALTSSEIRTAEKRAYNKLRSHRSLSTYKLMAYVDFAGIDRTEAMLR